MCMCQDDVGEDVDKLIGGIRKDDMSKLHQLLQRYFPSMQRCLGANDYNNQ